MSALYRCFMKHPPAEIIETAILNLSATYPSLSQTEFREGTSVVRAISAGGGEALLRIDLAIPPPVVRAGSGANYTVEFGIRLDTPESVGLCWEALQSVMLECSCAVWISEKMYGAKAIEQHAELRPVEFATDDNGFLLNSSEFESLAGN